MKKLIALLLSLVTVFSVTACGSDTAQNPTTQAAEVTDATAPEETAAPTTQATEPVVETPTEETAALEETPVTAEELLQKAEATTVTGQSLQQYLELLHGLGYTEICHDFEEFPVYPESQCWKILSLTYNDLALRLELEVYEDDFSENGDYLGQTTKTVTMYATKAEGIGNITGMDPSSYEYQEQEGYQNPRYTPTASMQKAGNCPSYNVVFAFNFGDPEDPHFDGCAFLAELYYPTTGNLYNFVDTEENELSIIWDIPNNFLITLEAYYANIRQETDIGKATLSEAVPAEILLSEPGTQTITLSTLREYEDMLHALGFEEVMLNDMCEPVSLTFNQQAFRLDFVYCYTNSDTGEPVREEGWSIYGTKASDKANISSLKASDYTQTQTDDFTQYAYQGIFDDFCYEMTESFIQIGQSIKIVGVRIVYYPATGSLYNYYRDPSCKGNPVEVVGSSMQAEVVGLTVEMYFHRTPYRDNAG